MADRITKLRADDIRFPTSANLDGSDAKNKDPDYSAAYITLETEQGGIGNGLVFTIGRGNDLCCQAIESLGHLVIGKDLGNIKDDIGVFYDELRSDSQLQWLGPEKGVIHMAIGGVINSVWDLWARSEQKPLWRLLSDMTPHQLVRCMDFRYLEDVLTRKEALEILQRNHATREQRIHILEEKGYPAYTTSAGWLGYDDDRLRRLCREAVDSGFKHVKLKVGQDLDDDIRRCAIARETIGPDIKLMVDANQAWEVNQAIDWMQQLERFDPWFIEEPTSPDDIAGHKKIRNALLKTKVATGEQCQNRVIFKQFIAEDAIDILQIDSCRMAGLNEVLTVYMLAAKFGKLVCPHAGGVGLCEYVQHMAMIDYIMISAEIGERVVEYVDHLHEHFEDPVRLTGGAYQTPTEPGFSIRMHASSLEKYRFPDGEAWAPGKVPLVTEA